MIDYKEFNDQGLAFCPFCGSDEVKAVQPTEDHPWFVDCANCGTAGPPGDNEFEAKTNWNLRS